MDNEDLNKIWPVVTAEAPSHCHSSPCATLQDCGLETRDRLDLVEEDLVRLRETTASIDNKMGAIEDLMVTMEEIVKVWRELESFIDVVVKIGRFFKWLTVIGGSVAAVVYAITHFGSK